MLTASQPKLAKNRRPVGEEFAKKAALLPTEARLARRMPYDLDKDDKLDPMQVLEEAMPSVWPRSRAIALWFPIRNTRAWARTCKPKRRALF